MSGIGQVNLANPLGISNPLPDKDSICEALPAYPEQLLTGERPEPSFLVAKPFREESLRATIRQALFFGAHLDA